MIKTTREIRHFHLFCGLGGGAKGFNSASPRVGNIVGRFRCIGGVDVDPAAIKDFVRMTGARGTVLDLFDRAQYADFHGTDTPAGWREAMPIDIRAAAGGEHPHIVFLSAPCKGFSGLLSQRQSATVKYQALNRLTLRGIWLMLEAFSGDPPELVIFENVPRIQNRGRHLLDQIGDLLRAYGYAMAETTHDCGEIGGLAQSRKRFLLVARHVAKVPPFLYEPEKKRLAAVGDVLGRMPLPGDMAGGPMHHVPSLAWKTWVRLAFVEAGSDWRSLNALDVENGVLRDYLVVPEYNHGYLSVKRWDEPSGTVSGGSLPSNGKFSVADPRFSQSAKWHDGQAYGVRRWDETCGTIAAGTNPGQGGYSVADPRPNLRREKGDHYLTGGHYGVVPWNGTSGAISASACCDNGRWSVADPRMPEANNKLICIIRALDGTWHRPFTTLELAALQSLIDPEETLELDGLSDQDWRERIGNAVPPDAARAIAEVMGTTLLLAWSGETFVLSAVPIWVRSVAVAMAVA
ncbi:MAG: DNA cytosine methyltransferase [Azoarcus sp.]|nr:DNA cytosine methyltransferase [Azoarcus sp.]